jgi:hypothetical protein
MSKSEPRSVTPLDLALVRRMLMQGLSLDMSAALTQGSVGLEDALLSTVPLADLGAPTMVMRGEAGGYVGQFRHHADETVARLVFLAPEPQNGDIPAWTRLLEAMAYEAGRRGVHLLSAEVAEDHPVFVAFRQAGFAVYARQIIVRHAPGLIHDPLQGVEPGILRPKVDADTIGINTLYASTVPQLLQQAELLPDSAGLVYERDGQIAGYLAVMKGKQGILIKPYFHPEVYDQAAPILYVGLAHIPETDYLPTYVYVRAYQDWLRGALEQMEFEAWTHQALMVKYTVVRVQRMELAPLPDLETSRLHPPVADGPLTYNKLTKRISGRFRHNGRNKKPYGTSNNG